MITKRSLLVFCALLFVGLSSNAMAHVSVAVGFAAPAPREVILPPPGYLSCYTVPGGYYNGIWINQHNECQYANAPGMWVAAHWECHRFDQAEGICKRWRWIPSYWAAPQMAGPMAMPGPAPVLVAAAPPPPVVYAPAPAAVVVGYGPGPYYHHHHWR